MLARAEISFVKLVECGTIGPLENGSSMCHMGILFTRPIITTLAAYYRRLSVASA
jgi:hypothetical protein